LHALGKDAEALPLAERAIQLAAGRNAPADNELAALVAQLRHSTTNSAEGGASRNASSDAAREPATRARRALLRG